MRMKPAEMILIPAAGIHNLHRLLGTTEIALRRAIGDQTEVTVEERIVALTELWQGLANAVIRLAAVIDHLAQE